MARVGMVIISLSLTTFLFYFEVIFSHIIFLHTATSRLLFSLFVRSFVWKYKCENGIIVLKNKNIYFLIFCSGNGTICLKRTSVVFWPKTNGFCNMFIWNRFHKDPIARRDKRWWSIDRQSVQKKTQHLCWQNSQIIIRSLKDRVWRRSNIQEESCDSTYELNHRWTE